MKSQSLFASFAPCILAAALWATPARADYIAEYTTAGATVNSALVGFPGTDGLFGATNEIATSGTHLFVANLLTGTIGEYTTSGALVNPGLVSGLGNLLPGPILVAVSGSDLFVGSDTGAIGEYTTAGATVNADLFSGSDIAGSGSDLFVVYGDKIGEYTTAGSTVNASLITILSGGPLYIAVSGSDLFVVNSGNGTIGEYTTSGGVVNASLVHGLSDPAAITVSGSDLFVVNNGGATIAEYTTAGATVNATLISTGPELLSNGIVVSGGDVFDALSVIPEPSTFVMLAIGAATLAVCGRRKRRAAN